MSVIKITEEDNLIIQPFMIGNLLLELKEKDFLNSEYFEKKISGSICEVLKSMTLDSQGMVIILFYTFLVIPYEKLRTKLRLEYEKINIKIDDAVTNKVFIVKNSYPDKDYLRHMRNSIAHVNFKFISNSSLTFIDEIKRKKYCFELTIPLNQIHNILFDLQALIINYFKDNREAIQDD